MSGNSSGNLSLLGLGDVGAGQSWGTWPLRKGHCGDRACPGPPSLLCILHIRRGAPAHTPPPPTRTAAPAAHGPLRPRLCPLRSRVTVLTESHSSVENISVAPCVYSFSTSAPASPGHLSLRTCHRVKPPPLTLLL